jgi:hypothetical protein
VEKKVLVDGTVTKRTTTLWDGWRPVMEIDYNAGTNERAMRRGDKALPCHHPSAVALRETAGKYPRNGVGAPPRDLRKTSRPDPDRSGVEVSAKETVAAAAGRRLTEPWLLSDSFALRF